MLCAWQYSWGGGMGVAGIGNWLCSQSNNKNNKCEGIGDVCFKSRIKNSTGTWQHQHKQDGKEVLRCAEVC